MKTNIKVAYSFKEMNKNSLRYGLINERTDKFANLREAMLFIRRLQNISVNGIQLVGKPVIES